MRFFKGFAAAAMLAALAPAAQAQVDDETAEEIRRGIKVWIGQYVQQTSGTITAELDGQITVIPDGGQYRATIPGGRAMAAGEGTLHFGEIAIDLTPMDNGWYEAQWRLPETYRIEPAYGSEGRITIGGQSGQGVIAPEFGTLMSMDAELSDIVVSEVDDDARLTIDRITLLANSDEVSPGIYDQRSNLRLDRLLFTENDGRNSFEVSDIEIAGLSDNGRLAELAEFQRQSNQLSMRIDGSNEMDQINAATAAFADLIDSMPTLLAGASIEARVGTVTIQERGDQFTMDAGMFSVSLDGLDQDRSQFALALGADGMNVSDPEVARLFPNESRFRLALTDLPNKELVEIGIGAMRSMGTTDPAMALLMASGGLQQALTAADSTVEIGPIRIASDTSSIDLEGVLRPDVSSPYGVVGEADMVATGLDTLIAEIQAVEGDQDVIQVLTLLQTLGAQAPDADGRTVRTYAFRLDSAGTLLLNGSDIMPLIGALQ